MESNYKYPIVADNYYELFGVKLFSIIDAEDVNKAYAERYKYWKSFISSEIMEDKTAALEELIKARKTLLHTEEKKRYDNLLKRRYYSQLQTMVDLTCKLIFENGSKFGLTEEEIRDLIIDCLKRE